MDKIKIKQAPIAYICSPYRGNIIKRIRNTRYAKKLTKKALQFGYIPITTHLYLTKVLNDKNEKERKDGLAAGQELLKKCDVIVVGIKYGVSEGMKEEIRQAEEKEIIYAK
jgi:chloramphenicol 3-O-phosphotransferase